MKLYFVSAIIQNPYNAKAWCCAVNDAKSNLSQAMELVGWMKNNHRVLSIWIDEFDDKQKTVVFHECYVDCFGETNYDKLH